MRPSPRRPHYVLLPVHLSVRPSVPLLTVNSKTENHTTFKLEGAITHVMSNSQNNVEVKMKGLGHWGGKMEVRISRLPLGPYALVFFKKCSDAKTATKSYAITDVDYWCLYILHFRLNFIVVFFLDRADIQGLKTIVSLGLMPHTLWWFRRWS